MRRLYQALSLILCFEMAMANTAFGGNRQKYTDWLNAVPMPSTAIPEKLFGNSVSGSETNSDEERYTPQVEADFEALGKTVLTSSDVANLNSDIDSTAFEFQHLAQKQFRTITILTLSMLILAKNGHYVAAQKCQSEITSSLEKVDRNLQKHIRGNDKRIRLAAQIDILARLQFKAVEIAYKYLRVRDRQQYERMKMFFHGYLKDVASPVSLRAVYNARQMRRAPIYFFSIALPLFVIAVAHAQDPKTFTLLANLIFHSLVVPFGIASFAFKLPVKKNYDKLAKASAQCEVYLLNNENLRRLIQ